MSRESLTEILAWWRIIVAFLLLAVCATIVAIVVMHTEENQTFLGFVRKKFNLKPTESTETE